MAKTPYEEYKANHTVHSPLNGAYHVIQEQNDLFIA